jgi:hypothetical protein
LRDARLNAPEAQAEFQACEQLKSRAEEFLEAAAVAHQPDESKLRALADAFADRLTHWVKEQKDFNDAMKLVMFLTGVGVCSVAGVPVLGTAFVGTIIGGTKVSEAVAKFSRRGVTELKGPRPARRGPVRVVPFANTKAILAPSPNVKRITRGARQYISRNLRCASPYLPRRNDAAIGKIIFMTNQPTQNQPDQKQQGDQNQKAGQQSQAPGTETKQPDVKTPDQK